MSTPGIAVAGSSVPSGALTSPGGAQGIQGLQGVQGVQGIVGDSLPIGAIFAFGSTTPPAGCLVADGSAVSRTTYPALFAVYGTLYGAGDGATTFNLPDMRGRVIVGQGQGSGLTNRVLAATGGEETHALQIAELPSHTHGLGNHTHVGGNHLHDLQNHTHVAANHLHGLGGHVHGIGSGINYASISVGTSGQGPYQFLFTPANGSAWISGTTGGPNTATDGADRSLGTTGPSPNNTGWCDRDITTSGPSTNTSDATGSGSGHNVMQPFMVWAWMVKASASGTVSPSAPLADSTQNGMLRKISGLTTDYVDGTNNCVDFATAVRTFSPVVRSYSSIGNPNFEVDARTVGVGAPSSGGFAVDRWQGYASGISGTWIPNSAPSGVIIAGTNFCISSKFLRFTLGAQKLSLAATDLIFCQQTIEGPRFRELLGGPTSGFLVVRSSVAGTTVSFNINDNANAWSCVQIATITNANAWTALSYPNFPIWTPSGTFGLNPGVAGYSVRICIAAGSQYTAGTANQWVSGNLVAAPTQANFAANAVNSTFDVGWIQHEPGPTPNGVLDKDWETNYRECLRHYCKSTNYGNVPCQGNWATIGMSIANNTQARLTVRFPVDMAKVPTMRWTPNSTTLGQVWVDGIGAFGVSTPSVFTSGVSNIVLASAPTVQATVLSDWDAATGW